LRAVPILKDVGITAKVIRMDPYKDPDEFIKNLGAEAFEERIGKARNGFMFGLEVLEREYDMQSPEGKTDFMREAARRLTEFDEELFAKTMKEEGREEGREEGKKIGAIRTYQRLGIPPETARQYIMEEFGTNAEEADELLRTYWI